MALPISKHPRLLSQPHDEIRLSLLPDWSAIYSHISPVGLRSTLTMPNAPRLLHRLPFQEDESSDEDCSENRHASVLLTNETWLPLGQSIVEEIYNPSNEAPHILPPNRDIDRSYSPLSPAPYLSVNSPNNHLYIQTIAHGRSGEASSPDFTEGQRSVRTNPMPLVPSTMQMFFNGSPIQRPLPTPPHVEDSNSPNMVMKHLSSGGSESPAQPQPRTQEVMSRMFLEKFRALDANYELTVQLLEELEGDDEPQTRLAFHSNNWGEGGGGDGGGDGGHSALPHPRTRYQSMPLVPSLMQMFSSGSPTQRLLPTPPHAEGSNSPNMVGRHLPSGGSETPAQPQPRTQEVMSRMFLAKFKALDANYDLTGQWLNEVEPSGKAQAEAVSHSNASVSSMFDGKGSEQGSTARSDIGNRGWRRNRQHLPVKRRPLRVSSTQPHDTWPELSSEDNDSSDESSEVYDSFYEADVESGALPFNVEARYRAG
ncbi:hypothetical protein DL96DRAFT_1650651 [Flagelloscypha sp. PMI_526]|nr:hypothetical protein DL96DRAFT_1650651 [Flagelloscypha sp. PMI_526]